MVASTSAPCFVEEAAAAKPSCNREMWEQDLGARLCSGLCDWINLLKCGEFEAGLARSTHG